MRKLPIDDVEPAVAVKDLRKPLLGFLKKDGFTRPSYCSFSAYGKNHRPLSSAESQRVSSP